VRLVAEAKAVRHSVALAARRFLPFSWSDYRWQWFSSFERFAWVFIIIWGDCFIMLNSFFLFHVFK
jgi:hypothetical protein